MESHSASRFTRRSFCRIAAKGILGAAAFSAACSKNGEEVSVRPGEQSAPVAPAAATANSQAASGPAVPVGSTLENLQAAFPVERNDQARYAAFAAKAHEEGYEKVASLFRAASKADEIHANNHEETIDGLDGTAEEKPEPPDAKSTKDNLATARENEMRWRTAVYPAYLKKARAEGNADAIRTFNYALAVDAAHEKLFKETEEKLEELKGPDGQIFYVCPTCGNTVKKADFTFEKCPICFTPASLFQEVK